VIGFKLFRQRVDGTYGSLFINRPQRLVLGTWYKAEDHRTEGYKHRPGWHICLAPYAPHLSTRDRVWMMVNYRKHVLYPRPVCQGGDWVIAREMRIEGVA
jgi:hypothetical protein